MPVTVKIDPAVGSLQAQIIQDATPKNDGVMTAAQAAKLAGLGGGGAFYVRITQPLDGTDFDVTIPPSIQATLAGANYIPIPVIMTANIFTGIAMSLVDQTSSQFRVTTDGTLPDGTVLGFVIQALS